MKKITSILISCLLTPLVLAAPPSLKGSNVTFQLPDTWVVQRHYTQREAEILQLIILDPATDNTPDSSNAGLSAEPIQNGVDVQAFGNFKLAPRDSSFMVLTDIPAGEYWRTVVSTAHQGETPYIIVDRFGVNNGWMVALRVSFPIISRADTNWVDRTLQEINAVISSLKINGTNVVNSEVRRDKELIWLREYSDTFRWTEDALKKGTYRAWIGSSNQALEATPLRGSPQR